MPNCDYRRPTACGPTRSRARDSTFFVSFGRRRTLRIGAQNADKPELLHAQPRVLIFAEGERAELSCSMHGNPKPTRIVWAKNGIALDAQGLSTSGDGGSLVLRSVSRADEAIYSCFSSTFVGKSQVYEFHGINERAPITFANLNRRNF